MIDSAVQFSNFILGIAFKLYLGQLAILLLSNLILLLLLVYVAKFRYKNIISNKVLNKSVERKSINPSNLLIKNIKFGLIPIIGLKTLVNLYYLYINFIAPFEKVKENKDNIFNVNIFEQLEENLNRFGIECSDSIKKAKILIQNKSYESTILSSTEILNSTLADIENTDTYTENQVNELYSKYVSLLGKVSMKPSNSNLTMIELATKSMDNISEYIDNDESNM